MAKVSCGGCNGKGGHKVYYDYQAGLSESFACDCCQGSGEEDVLEDCPSLPIDAPPVPFLSWYDPHCPF